MREIIPFSIFYLMLSAVCDHNRWRSVSLTDWEKLSILFSFDSIHGTGSELTHTGICKQKIRRISVGRFEHWPKSIQNTKRALKYHGVWGKKEPLYEFTIIRGLQNANYSTNVKQRLSFSIYTCLLRNVLCAFLCYKYAFMVCAHLSVKAAPQTDIIRRFLIIM